MKKLILFVLLLITVNISVSAGIISYLKLRYDLVTLEDPEYMAMMDHIGEFCGNNKCESFRLPSVSSMAPVLAKNDTVLVNKSAYLKNRPQRGDIIVFKYPDNPDAPYISRVVGLPGEHIAYRKKVLYINARAGTISYQTKYVLGGHDVEEYIEKIQGIEYKILFIPERPGVDGEYTVLDNSYFLMGDNRDNANDSRYRGVVNSSHIIGKVMYIMYGTDDSGNLNKKRLAIKL